jgi:hypothetical protein
MNEDKKLYLYSGLAIALAVVAYVVITNKKPLAKPADASSSKEEEEEESDLVVTPSGDTITPEQAIIDPTLTEILKLPLAQIKLKMLNKKVYTKLDNVNPRTTPYVNNGWFVNNSVGGKITQKGTLAGIVTDVAQDEGKMSNSQGKVYIWFKIKPSAQAIKQIKDDSNIFLGTKRGAFWLREDVIIKK